MEIFCENTGKWISECSFIKYVTPFCDRYWNMKALLWFGLPSLLSHYNSSYMHTLSLPVFLEKVQFAKCTLKVGTYLTKILWFHWFTKKLEPDFSFLFKNVIGQQLHRATGIVKILPPINWNWGNIFIWRKLKRTSPHVPIRSGGPAAKVNRYYFVPQMK